MMHTIEKTECDYKVAFGHLAYIVGKLSATTDESAKAQLLSEADAVINAVYTPMFMMRNEDAEPIAEAMNRDLIRNTVLGSASPSDRQP